MALRLHRNDKGLGQKQINTCMSFWNHSFNKLGYTKTLSEKRVRINQNYSAGLTKVNNRNWDEDVNVLVAGSRGEGMNVSMHSDIDMLLVQPAVKCIEMCEQPTSKTSEIPCDVALFEIDLDSAPVGYAQLRLIAKKEESDLTDPKKYSSLLNRINQALKERNKCQYLRNDCKLISTIEDGGDAFKRSGFLSDGQSFEIPSGPSQPIRVPLPFGMLYLEVDYVPAFPYYMCTALNDFCKRTRSHTWPNEKTISAIKKAMVLIVPAGEPGDDDTLNWRISFTIAEKLLVQSFNDTQIKVYAALKMLAKFHLKPKCPAITSYVVKNILFWVFESNPGTFEEDDFIELLVKALQFLKIRVDQENLENYMIPSRNMLRKRITGTEQTALLQCIDTMIEEGPRVLLRCPLVQEVGALLEDDNALQTRLIFRESLDQLLLSFHALPPDDFDRIEMKLHKAKTREEVITTFIEQVFPIIKKSNPFEYFDRLISMENEELSSRIKEGIKGDHLVWLGQCKILGSSS